jgi:hypothetical protein
MTFRPTIRGQQDLEDAWRYLMSPLGFSGTSLWFMLIDADDQPVPQVTQIDDAARAPTPAEIAGLADVIGELRDEHVPGGRVAFLRSRPGRPALTREDRAWARALYGIGQVSDLPVEVVHLACDVDVVPLPMDDAHPDSAA